MGFWNFENEMEKLADRKQKAVSTSLNIGLCPPGLHPHLLNTVPYGHNVVYVGDLICKASGHLKQKDLKRKYKL